MANLQEEVCNSDPLTFPPNDGGVIANTADKNFAIGIYAVNTSQGGSVDYLLLNYTWTCPGPPTDAGEYGSDTTIVDAARTGSDPAGTTRSNVYVVSGTLKMVIDKMAELYRLRDSIPQ